MLDSGRCLPLYQQDWDSWLQALGAERALLECKGACESLECSWEECEWWHEGDNMQGHLVHGLGSPYLPPSCSSPFTLLCPGQLAFVFLPYRVLVALSTV